MTGSDLVLHFVYPAPTGNNDMRTVQIKQVPEGEGDEILGKLLHPRIKKKGDQFQDSQVYIVYKR